MATQQSAVYDSVYGMNPWAETIAAMHSGEAIEISEDVFNYFLGVLPPVYMGVLPPVYMGARRIVGNGAARCERRVSLGFAEGEEPIVAFWFDGKRTVEDGPGGGTLRFYCQRTAEINSR